MEWDKFWSTNKKKYEQTAHRYMGVFKDTCVELNIENAPAGDVVSIPVALHPKVCQKWGRLNEGGVGGLSWCVLLVAMALHASSNPDHALPSICV